MGVQYVSPEEALLMQGRHPHVRSVIVVVSNFTTLGNTVQQCSCRLFSGTFVSYVREDDDYYSLTRRFGAITGEADFDKYRLAVLDNNRIPSFIARPSAAPTAAAAAAVHAANANATADDAGDAGSAANNVKKASIWELLLSKNPTYAENNDLRKQPLAKLKHKNSTPYPHISIQRSAADIPSNSRYCCVFIWRFLICVLIFMPCVHIATAVALNIDTSASTTQVASRLSNCFSALWLHRIFFNRPL